MPLTARRTSARTRLPRSLSAVVGLFGAAWLALPLLSFVDGGSSGALRIANLAVNLSGSIGACAVAWIGTRPRPSQPLSAARLTAAIAAGAIPAAAAIIEGLVARHLQVPSTASADLWAAAIVGVALVAVCRSQPETGHQPH